MSKAAREEKFWGYYARTARRASCLPRPKNTLYNHNHYLVHRTPKKDTLHGFQKMVTTQNPLKHKAFTVPALFFLCIDIWCTESVSPSVRWYHDAKTAMYGQSLVSRMPQHRSKILRGGISMGCSFFIKENYIRCAKCGRLVKKREIGCFTARAARKSQRPSKTAVTTWPTVKPAKTQTQKHRKQKNLWNPCNTRLSGHPARFSFMYRDSNCRVTLFSLGWTVTLPSGY